MRLSFSLLQLVPLCKPWMLWRSYDSQKRSRLVLWGGHVAVSCAILPRTRSVGGLPEELHPETRVEKAFPRKEKVEIAKSGSKRQQG